MAINVDISFFDTPLSDECFRVHVESLPLVVQDHILAHRRWQDRQAILLSRVLLRNRLFAAGHHRDCLERIVVDENGRARLEDSDVDFSLSHCTTAFGGGVACAIDSSGSRVGIDIELPKRMLFVEIRDWLRQEDWVAIEQSTEPMLEFFVRWTMKESVAKADGRGLSILSQVAVSGAECAILDGKKWSIRRISTENDYICHLAFEDGTVDDLRAVQIHQDSSEPFMKNLFHGPTQEPRARWR